MLQCPKCNSEIGETDFNVSTNLAYCRNCQSHMQYSDIRAAVNGTDFLNLPCPKYVSINELGDRIEIVYRKISPAVLFLIPFTIIWGGFSLGIGFVGPLLNNKLNLVEALVAIPFLIGTVVLTSVILYLLLSKLRIVLDGTESEVYRGVGLLAWRNQFDCSNLTCVSIQNSSLTINEVVQTEICLIMNEGEPIKFGSLMHKDSKAYVAAAIAKRIERGSSPLYR